MILPLLADGAALVAACFAWRVSRPIATAIALAVVASLVHARTGIEALRWSSALVGLVGAVELASGLEPLRIGIAYVRFMRERNLDVPKPWGVIRMLPRRAVLGIFAFASMAGDGAALLAWRGLGEWVQPVAQIFVSGAMGAVCVWPQRRKP